MKKIVFTLALLALIVIAVFQLYTPNEILPSQVEKLKEKYSKKYTPSVDHSQFTVLQKKFATPQEVTETCITCHNKRHVEVMESNHWNWEKEE